MILVDSRGTTMELFEQGLKHWRAKRAKAEGTYEGSEDEPAGGASSKRQTRAKGKK